MGPAPMLVASVLCVPVWQAPGALDLLLFVVCGVFGALGIVFVNAAYQRAPVAVIVPFEYTALFWAAAAGFAIWGERPDLYAWLGGAVIISSGLFILYRETRTAAGPSAVPSAFPLQEAPGAAPTLADAEDPPRREPGV